MRGGTGSLSEARRRVTLELQLSAVRAGESAADVQAEARAVAMVGGPPRA